MAMPNADLKIGDKISFELYNSYKIDTTEIRTNNTPFTQFELVYDLKTWKRKAQFTNFTFPEFDFTADDYQDRYLAVSFNREVLEMEVIGVPFASDMMDGIEVAITYAEEYCDQTMFLYIMDRIPIYLDEGSKYYIMNGTEKIFVGHSESEFYKWDH